MYGPLLVINNKSTQYNLLEMRSKDQYLLCTVTSCVCGFRIVTDFSVAR